MHILLSRVDANGREKIEDALAPPNRIDPRTGLPYGWDEESELDGLDRLLTG